MTWVADLDLALYPASELNHPGSEETVWDFWNGAADISLIYQIQNLLVNKRFC